MAFGKALNASILEALQENIQKLPDGHFSGAQETCQEHPWPAGLCPTLFEALCESPDIGPRLRSLPLRRPAQLYGPSMILLLRKYGSAARLTV